nr:odorant-binding protein 12 [Glyphodes caesalis]
MFLKKSFVILCAVLVFNGANAGVLENLNKCGKDDGECHKNLLQFMMREASKTGIPELGIPTFDPVELKDVHLPIKDVVDLHLEEGLIKGLRKCVVNKFITSIEKGHAKIDITCDLTLKGHYKAYSNSPLVQSFLGAAEVKGDGNAKVKIEQINIVMDLGFAVEKRDGQTYLKEGQKPSVKYEILGKVVFAVDHLYVGDKDESTKITNLMNENWKFIASYVGEGFLERTIDHVRGILRNFFEKVPTSTYISDDLTPYAS